jgi:hypothetical protein
MTAIQTLITAIIEDVNHENGIFLQTCGKITDFLFHMIKWTSIPYIVFLLFSFFRHFA